MKEILKVVFTFRYLWKAFVTICVTAFMVYITRDNLTTMLYMIVFGGWTLAYLYVLQTKSPDDPDCTDY